MNFPIKTITLKTSQCLRPPTLEDQSMLKTTYFGRTVNV